MTDFPITPVMLDSTYPGDIYTVAEGFRDDLLQGERTASSAMIRSYESVWGFMSDEITRLSYQYNKYVKQGLTPDSSWLYEIGRIRLLRAEVEKELSRFSTIVHDRILQEQSIVVEDAQEHAMALVRSAWGYPVDNSVQLPGEIRLLLFNRLPTESIESLIGFMQDGSPLRDLLNGIPEEGGKIIESGLIQGLALGQNPKVISKNIQKQMGAVLSRVLVIARTEVLRSYREASRLMYEQNSSVINGWIWMSARNTRTCAMCWAMDGTSHQLKERLDDHPCGRCFMIPDVKSWEQLGQELGVDFSGLDGLKKESERPKTGIEAFELLADKEKMEVLGRAKFAAYQDGLVSLKDFVGRKYNRRWGSMRFERSLRSILGVKAKEYYRKPEIKKKISTGKPVSDALLVPGGTLKPHIEDILSIIDSVHGDGELPVIPIKSSVAKSYYGAYYSRYDGTADHIKVSLMGDHFELTAAHEIGHFLDHQTIGEIGEFASVDSDLLEEWRTAIDASEAINMLHSYKYKTMVDDKHVNKKHVRYLLTREEQFARSYAQYIAETSQDENLIEQLDAIRYDENSIYRYKQWGEDDFTDIRIAFDHLLEELGWVE